MFRSLGASFVLASAMLMPLLRSAPAVAAADPDPPARVMLKVNWIHVVDDSDPEGSGELNYTVKMQRTAPGCGGTCFGPFFEHTFRFSVDSGERVSYEQSPERFVPYYRAQPDLPQPFFVYPEPGLDLYPGMSLRILWKGKEADAVFDDEVGSILDVFTENQDWGMGAVHETFSADTLGFGGFGVNYEIIRAPLPDLQVSDIRVGNFADNGDDIACMTVTNSGPEPASPYKLRLYVDGAIPRNGEIIEAGHLIPGGSLERCFQTTIASGQHQFLAIVDQDQEVPEINELNNGRPLTATIARRGPGGSVLPVGPLGQGVLDVGTSDPGPQPSPTATQAPTQADLMPLNLRVEGKVPQGENDCESGRRDITVQVKNDGGTDAASFTVALLVDGEEDDGGKETVQAVARGQQADVQFDNVRLRKGTHELTVKVDVDNKITESAKNNNELKVAVTCNDDDE